MSEQYGYLYTKCCVCVDFVNEQNIDYSYMGCGCPYLSVSECESDSIRAYMCGEMDELETEESPPNVYKTVKNLYSPKSYLHCTHGCLNMADRFLDEDPYTTRDYEREVVAVNHPQTGNFLYYEVQCTSESESTGARCMGYESNNGYYTSMEQHVTSATLCTGYNSSYGYNPCTDRNNINTTVNNAVITTTRSTNDDESSYFDCESTTTKSGSIDWSQAAEEQCDIGTEGSPTTLYIKFAGSGSVPYSDGTSSNTPRGEVKYDWGGEVGCDEANFTMTDPVSPDYINISNTTLGPATYPESSLIDHGNDWDSNGKMFSNPDNEESAINDSEGTRHESLDGNSCTSVYELRTSRLDFLKRTASVNISAHNIVKDISYTACITLSRREAFAVSESDLDNNPSASRGEWERVESQSVTFTAGSTGSIDLLTEYELPHARGYEYSFRAGSLQIFPNREVTQNCSCPTINE